MSNGGKDFRIVVVGCTNLARVGALAAEDVGHLEAVVNLDPGAGAAKAGYDPLSDFQDRRPGDVHLTRDINGEETRRWIAGRAPDVVLQLGWSQIFGTPVLRLPRLFCAGVHPAPLPVGRGAAVLNWKIIEGGGPWGCSLYVMEEKTDTGDVLDFEPFDIDPEDDIRTAYAKSDAAAERILRRTLPALADGSFHRRAQDDAKATRYYSRKPEDGAMAFSWPAQRILAHIRALTHPYPGAFFDMAGSTVLVWRAAAGAPDGAGTPGTIVEIGTGRGVRVRVGADETVWLEQIEADGDPDRQADEWVRDKGLTAGSNLSQVIGPSNPTDPDRSDNG